MPTVYDVPQDILIKRLAEQLKKMPQIKPPAWAAFVKTGSHAERPPQDKDWWYVRCASLLRKLYIHGPLGLNDLRSMYGGRVRRGLAPAHHRDAGGSSIRKALQQLEAVGLVAKIEGKGRVLTNLGRKKLDKLATEIFKELVKENPSLARYA
ncbi:MAG: 30S ribosomal protein S19e [Nitrososphaerota archaeon]|nr:30S ribosomal protein S19e [Nitrososphaerales archaeon]MDW8044595.1 30S ribosomal protein S19e [Nitrososphaerota archaeon]